MSTKKREVHKKVLVFGGTSEGRMLIEMLLAEDFFCTACVATEYGAQCLPGHPNLEVLTGRMDCAAMTSLLSGDPFLCVVDATHPHAAVVTGEIQRACANTGVPCLRYSRKTGYSFETGTDFFENTDSEYADSRQLLFAEDMREAAALLAEAKGKILVTTGSREIELLVSELGEPSRIIARVLPAEESLQACARAGLAGRQIIAMQGPFDVEMNSALIRHYGVSWLLTKETGRAGGFQEKIEAARLCGIGAVVIRNPEKNDPFFISQRASKTKTEKDDSRFISQKFSQKLSQKSSQKPSQKPSLEQAAQTDPFFISQSLEEIIEKIRQLAEREKGGKQAVEQRKRELALVGVGVGAPEARTREAQEVLEKAQVIFGAPGVLRMLRQDPAFGRACLPEKPDVIEKADFPGKPVDIWKADLSGKSDEIERTYLPAEKIWIPEYDSEKILAYLSGHPWIERAAVAYSGDSGFYSGAASMTSLVKQMRESWQEEEKMSVGKAENDRLPLPEIRLVSGISSISWFAARAQIPWQDMKILSSHGRECNVIGHVRRYHKCFLLLSGASDLRHTAGLLEEGQKNGLLGRLRLICGYAMSRPEEEIRECSTAELREVNREGLYVLYIEHRDASDTPVVPGLSDSAFVRGRVPMTSSEIRALSLCRLRLTPQAVVYDIGAGTGSVSVEAALICPEGTVYSIERNEKAVELLKENRDRFCLSNMKIIEGEAPQAMKPLPPPTHAFIGGSGGNMEEIIRLLLEKNPYVRIVANCITIETLVQIRAAIEKLPVIDVEWTQISASCGDTLGSYHYLRARNPVFVISFTGNADKVCEEKEEGNQ